MSVLEKLGQIDAYMQVLRDVLLDEISKWDAVDRVAFFSQLGAAYCCRCGVPSDGGCKCGRDE